MKKTSALILIASLSLAIYTPAFADLPLRNPQGRLGTYYKPEPYTPLRKTNLTQQELSNIGNIIQEAEEAQKNSEKEQRAQQKKNELEQKQLLAKEKEEQKRLADEEKRRLAEQQREEELKAKALEKEKLTKENQETEQPSKLNFFKKKPKKDSISKSENKFAFFQKLSKKEVEAPQQPEVQPQEETPVQSQITSTDKATKIIVTEITEELTEERKQMLEELSILWVNAVQKSDTVYFAIMKLSNPNGEEVNKSGMKKILAPILNAAPLVGQAFVNPALTAGSLIGSNLMGTMMDDSAKTRLSKVNDADLVILARAIDELQEELLMNYMAYKNSKKEYDMAIKIADERKNEYETLNKKNSPNTVLANTFYTEALDNQYKARQTFLMKRIVLEQMVGADGLNEIENPKPKTEEENPELKEPENKPTTAPQENKK